jgi:hypothetical protein
MWPIIPKLLRLTLTGPSLCPRKVANFPLPPQIGNGGENVFPQNWKGCIIKGQQDNCSNHFFTKSNLDLCRYSVVFLTNQNLKDARLKAWVEKISFVAEAVSPTHTRNRFLFDSVSCLLCPSAFWQQLLLMYTANHYLGCGGSLRRFSQLMV